MICMEVFGASRVTAAIACLTLASAFSAPLVAGPNRASSVDSTPTGAADLKPDGTTGALHEDGSYVNSQGETVYSELDHYCRVSIGPNKQTWVEGVGKIVILPTTLQYTKTYELRGWDAIERVGTITGCELSMWESGADCWISLQAHAGKIQSDTGAVVAQCSAELYYWEYNQICDEDAAECTVSTSTGSNESCDYEDDTGRTWPERGTQAIMSGDGGVDEGIVSNTATVYVPLHPNAFIPILQLKQKEFARLYMNVEPAHGFSNVDVVHGTWTPPSESPQTNYWKVKMDAWDWDDPSNPIRFDRYSFDGAANQ